jgi:predicted methyltransferase
MTIAGSNIALRIGAAVPIGLATLASTGAVPACAQDYAAIVAQADRTEADRATDNGGIQLIFLGLPPDGV